MSVPPPPGEPEPIWIEKYAPYIVLLIIVILIVAYAASKKKKRGRRRRVRD